MLSGSVQVLIWWRVTYYHWSNLVQKLTPLNLHQIISGTWLWLSHIRVKWKPCNKNKKSGAVWGFPSIDCQLRPIAGSCTSGCNFSATRHFVKWETLQFVANWFMVFHTTKYHNLFIQHLKNNTRLSKVLYSRTINSRIRTINTIKPWFRDWEQRGDIKLFGLYC